MKLRLGEFKWVLNDNKFKMEVFGEVVGTYSEINSISLFPSNNVQNNTVTPFSSQF